MSPITSMCAGCVIVLVGTLALVFPTDTMDLARQCHAWVRGELDGDQNDPLASARRFDELVSEMNAIDDVPRPEMKRDPYMPHMGIVKKAAPAQNWKNQFARASTKNRTQTRRTNPLTSRPEGIFARSRLGMHRSGISGSKGNAKSIFEQSRFYHRKGSAFDRIHIRMPYGRSR